SGGHRSHRRGGQGASGRTLRCGRCTRSDKPYSHHHVFAQRANADNRRYPRICPSRSAHVLRPKLLAPVPTRRRTGRQDSDRSEARRHSGRAAEKVRSRNQFDDRQGAQADDPGIVPIARRRVDRMNRRVLMALLGGAVAWPLAARAQRPVIPVIGYLHSGSSAPYAHLVAAFRQSLKEAGYVEGENVAIEYRWAEGRYDRLPALATELVGRHVTLIVAQGGDPPVLAAKSATATI